MMKVLSLGAGVQSTTLTLMAIRGEIEMPDYAIFADTGAEPREVYDHLDWLEVKMADAGLPYERVSIGRSLRDDVRSRWSLKGTGSATSGEKRRFVTLPAFTTGSDGRPAIMRRQCTSEFKVQPIEKKIRQLAGIKRFAGKEPLVEHWFGITTDEFKRCRISPHKWSRFRYPLIELRMSRNDCLWWLDKNGFYRPPRSACIFCPYHTDEQWRHLKNNSPEEFAEAVKVDYEMRSSFGMRKEAFLHRSLRPLDQVDFRTLEEHGQSNLFDCQACEGMCGV